MITGTLLKLKTGSNPPIPPIPYLQANISIPRFNASKTLSLLADTGSDSTCLHLRDSLSLIKLDKFKDLTNIKPSLGTGGQAHYHKEPAIIVFKHDDGTLESFDFELCIITLSQEALRDLNSRGNLSPNTHKELSWKMKIPSILGRDILGSFRVIFDCCKSEFYLTH